MKLPFSKRLAQQMKNLPFQYFHSSLKKMPEISTARTIPIVLWTRKWAKTSRKWVFDPNQPTHFNIQLMLGHASLVKQGLGT